MTDTAQESGIEEVTHASDCATHNMPAAPNAPCDCNAVPASIATTAVSPQTSPKVEISDVIPSIPADLKNALEDLRSDIDSQITAKQEHYDGAYSNLIDSVCEIYSGTIDAAASLCLAHAAREIAEAEARMERFRHNCEQNHYVDLKTPPKLQAALDAAVALVTSQAAEITDLRVDFTAKCQENYGLRNEHAREIAEREAELKEQRRQLLEGATMVKNYYLKEVSQAARIAELEGVLTDIATGSGISDGVYAGPRLESIGDKARAALKETT